MIAYLRADPPRSVQMLFTVDAVVTVTANAGVPVYLASPSFLVTLAYLQCQIEHVSASSSASDLSSKSS